MIPRINNSNLGTPKILSKRFFHNASYWQQVFEWEDVLVKHLSASIFPNFSLEPFAKLRNVVNHFPLCPSSPTVIFEMNPERRWINNYNKENVIPYIIDFYLDTSEKLDAFYKNYCNHKVILISSIEAYNYLKAHNCPLNIVHSPLTISDIYSINSTTCYSKEIDLLLMGRQNKVMQDYLNKYLLNHELNIVSCKVEKGHFNYYDKTGKFYGNADKRSGIMDLLKKSRISLYTEKGLEGDLHRGAHSDMFIHVTPRLFEYIVTGNHVIASYANLFEYVS